MIRLAGSIAGLLVAVSFAGCGPAEEATGIPRPPASERPFEIETLLEGLDFPASVNFAPDGTVFILERGAIEADKSRRYPPRLKRYDLGTGELLMDQAIANSQVVPAPRETINGGALGLELDPEFVANGRVYICYHYLRDESDNKSGRNRLSSFLVAGASLNDEQILVDDLPGGANHNGCRVVVGPDDHLYLATGVGLNNDDAADLESLGGKILRLRKDGSAPDDNPFPGSLVWSYGHRNPQGLAFEPGTGRLWSTEHGKTTDDELNLIEAGKHYGFPHCGGEASLGDRWGPYTNRSWKNLWLGRRSYLCTGEGLDASNYRPAAKSYYPGSTLAISDMTFYDGAAFPEWRDSLFIVSLKTGRLNRAVLSEGGVTHDELLIDGGGAEDRGRLRDVTVGPDGFLYVVTNPRRGKGEERGGMLLRIRPPVSERLARP